MDWSTVRAKILSVVASCVRVDTYWRDRERPFVRPMDSASPTGEAGVTCLLHVISSIGIGVDEIKQKYNTGTELIDLTQTGNRRFTVSVLVESYNQADAKTAHEYIERLRSCLERSQIKDLLREANLTILPLPASVDLSDFRDDRAVSVASLDLPFLFLSTETKDDGPGLESIGWIEHVYGNHADEDLPGVPDAEDPADPAWKPPQWEEDT